MNQMLSKKERTLIQEEFVKEWCRTVNGTLTSSYTSMGEDAGGYSVSIARESGDVLARAEATSYEVAFAEAYKLFAGEVLNTKHEVFSNEQ